MEKNMPHPRYYYSESEWNRLGCGELPPERNIEMTTFTSEDREEAEKRQKLMNELQKKPEDWDATSNKWPFTENDELGEDDVPNFKEE
jgi:hypothetical protein